MRGNFEFLWHYKGKSIKNFTAVQTTSFLVSNFKNMEEKLVDDGKGLDYERCGDVVEPHLVNGELYFLQSSRLYCRSVWNKRAPRILLDYNMKNKTVHHCGFSAFLDYSKLNLSPDRRTLLKDSKERKKLLFTTRTRKVLMRYSGGKALHYVTSPNPKPKQESESWSYRSDEEEESSSVSSELEDNLYAEKSYEKQ